MRFLSSEAACAATLNKAVVNPPISYPHVILLLHLKSVWSALLRQELSLEIWVIRYCLQLHQITTSTLATTASPRELYLHICTFRVLKYACCFACIFILPSAERSSYCVMIPQKQVYPKQCLEI